MKYYAAAVTLFLLIVLGAISFGQLSYTWQAWTPATCLPDHCFCEAQGDGIIKQPVNTFSSLGFVLVGLLVIADTLNQTPKIPRILIHKQPAFPRLYGVAVIIIGLGSFYYHASLTFVGQWFDVMGMYLQITFVLVFALARRWEWQSQLFALAYGLSIALLGVGLIIIPQLRREIFVALVLGALLAELWTVRSRKLAVTTAYFWSALLAFALAYGIWTLDNTGQWCTPASLIQGHAFWHGLCALAAGGIYKYYRSEHPDFTTPAH